jgi:aldose sugar dehydrogenase
MKQIVRMTLGLALVIQGCALAAQEAPAAPAAPAVQRPAPPPGPRVTPLGDGPWHVASEQGPVHVEVLARGLDHPWSLAFLPDGGILVTERPGRLRIMRDGQLDPVPIAGLPKIYNLGIAGLKDIALHPNFINNRLIYISYSKPHPEDPQNATLAVLRARWDGGHALTDVEDIFVADAWYGKMPLPPKCCGQGPAFGSFGGRIAFDADGYLFVASGDRNYGEQVQDPANHFGKILRLNDDGSAPADNPYAGRPGWKPEIWSMGHRNPTGMTIDPATGTMWSTEFGPRGGDETNRIIRAGNYGWMDVTQGLHYDNTPAKGIKGVAGMIDPVLAWGPPSFNPGNLSVYRGAAFKAWQGDLLVAMMNKSLVRINLDEAGNAAGQEVLLQDLGQRLRDVRVGPDGFLYVLTDETAGALIRLSPGG